MPYNAPGLRKRAVATKIVSHGDPVVELGFAGVAFKTNQLNAFVSPTAAAVRSIAVAEPFIIQLGGVVEVAAAKITGGLAAVPEGTAVYIVPADNLITAVATANTKFGRVDSVDTARGVARINTNAKDSI